MKSSFNAAASAAASTSSVYVYQCPDTTSVSQACRSLRVHPLFCNNPNVNRDACNAKQCNQIYIDNYAACQCHRSPEQFYEHSVNIEGLLRRCDVASLTNPYGNLYQYRAGTIRVTSVVGFTTAAPIAGSTASPVPVNNQSKLSGGAIAGVVIGCLAAVALAGLLAWCWRKKRHEHTAVYDQHSTYDNHEPTRTVVTEKIEPIVVKAGTTNFNTSTPGNTPYTTSMTATPANNYSTGTNYDRNTHPSTSYNTTTTTNNGYNANAYNSGRNVVDGAQNAANTAYNTDHNAGRDPSNAAGNGARAAGNAANNAMH
ncbi:hypothetical protein BGZ52_009389 [Haplosporangium bisporale]|nr:hypothetical protein BGZ52_009389 [Haplosporangium bisporale]